MKVPKPVKSAVGTLGASRKSRDWMGGSSPRSDAMGLFSLEAETAQAPALRSFLADLRERIACSEGSATP